MNVLIGSRLARFEPGVCYEWQEAADGALAADAMKMVLQIADRLSDASSLAAEVERARSRTQGPYRWWPASLSSGYASIAVFFAFLAKASGEKEHWNAVARKYISLAVHATAETPLRHPGLHSGSAGLAMALLCMSECDPRYSRSADSACEQVAAHARHRRALRLTHDGRYIGAASFDVIAGDAGVLAVLLASPRPSPLVAETIEMLVGDLVELCSPGREAGPRSWLVDIDSTPDGPATEPRAWYDLGLAHGPLGPAAALSLAYLSNYHADGIEEAIHNVCSWVAERKVTSGSAIGWPAGLLPEFDDDAGARHKLRPARPGWCYGTGGVARALWLAGCAIDDSELQHVAVKAIESAALQSAGETGQNNVNLCHGIGGLLAICLRFVHEIDSGILWDLAATLTANVLALCRSDLPFFVTDHRPSGELVDDPGFLSGTAGVGLALLAATTRTEPRWDRALLLA